MKRKVSFNPSIAVIKKIHRKKLIKRALTTLMVFVLLSGVTFLLRDIHTNDTSTNMEFLPHLVMETPSFPDYSNSYPEEGMNEEVREPTFSKENEMETKNTSIEKVPSEWTDWSTDKSLLYNDNYETQTEQLYRERRVEAIEDERSYLDGINGWEKQEDLNKIVEDSDYIEYIEEFPSDFDTSNWVYERYHTQANKDDFVFVGEPSISGYVYYGVIEGSFKAIVAPSIWDFDSSEGGYVAYKSGTKEVYHSWDSSNPTRLLPVFQQKYTYLKTIYTYFSYGEWSDWQTDKIEKKSDNQVEIKTLYRYRLKEKEE